MRRQGTAKDAEKRRESAIFLEQIGANLRALRLAAGLSQNDLARLTGQRQTYVSYIEAGRTNVTVLTLLRIARALDADVMSFFS